MAKQPQKSQPQKQKEAVAWWIGKARSAQGYRRNLLTNEVRSRDVPIIGKMYFFHYDAKHKKTLPVWDRFPLVFPIGGYSDGFLGLNVHYLSIGERHNLLGKLLEFASSQRFTPSMKINMSYDLLQSTASLASLSRPCVKRYLFGHLRSSLIEIRADEWDRVIELPVEQFVYKQ